jgi:hypothetical protein
MVADGMTVEEILGNYQDLEAGDVREALEYGAEAVREHQLPSDAAREVVKTGSTARMPSGPLHPSSSITSA